MTHDYFSIQILRLETQWPNSYGDERRNLLWQAFKNCHNEIFQRAVSIVLSEQRGAPLVPQLEEAVNRAVREEASLRYYARNAQTQSAYGTLEAAAKTTSADPAFVQDCLALLRKKQAGLISNADFQKACDLLDSAADKINPNGKRNDLRLKNGCWETRPGIRESMNA